MHSSSMRYGGEPLLTDAGSRRGCGPVRVSYFDPRTGEPCEGKPKPLRKGRAAKPPTPEQRNAASLARAAAEREGAEIAGRMAARKPKRDPGKPRRSPGKEKKPVVVDGVRYESRAEASRATGIPISTLSWRAAGGAPVESASIRRTRPVVVDGARFESVAEAARRIGTSGKWLCACLKQGKRCKGREVRYAEGEA